jgi:hypothetical protein
MIFQKWPKKRGPARSDAQQQAQDDFKAACVIVKNMDPLLIAFAEDVAKGAPLLPRDLLMQTLYGRLGYVVLTSGRKIFSVAAYQDVSLLLDAIGQIPGMVLYRDRDWWKSLQPRLENDVLRLNADLMPEWGPAPSTGTVNVIHTEDVSGYTAWEWDPTAVDPLYKAVDIHLENWRPTTNGAGLRWRAATGSPPVYYTGSADYWWNDYRIFGGGSTGNNGGLNDHAEINAGNGIYAGTYGGISAVIKNYNFRDAAMFPRMRADWDLYDQFGYPAAGWGVSSCNHAFAPTRISFYLDNGPIVAGTVKVVGYLG